MKIGEIINDFNDIEDSAVGDRIKVRWIGEIDHKVRSIYKRYTDDEAAGFAGYDPEDQNVFDREVLIPDAHSAVYLCWMGAQNDLVTGDTDRYANHMIAFNTAWEDFVNEYNRDHEWKRAIQ